MPEATVPALRRASGSGTNPGAGQTIHAALPVRRKNEPSASRAYCCLAIRSRRAAAQAALIARTCRPGISPDRRSWTPAQPGRSIAAETRFPRSTCTPSPAFVPACT